MTEVIIKRPQAYFRSVLRLIAL